MDVEKTNPDVEKTNSQEATNSEMDEGRQSQKPILFYLKLSVEGMSNVNMTVFDVLISSSFLHSKYDIIIFIRINPDQKKIFIRIKRKRIECLKQ